MISIRFHGRGGQGVVTAAEVLATAVSFDGKYAQALPSFGPERSMAPVTSFCRIDDKPIRVYQEIYHPDLVVVLDQTLTGVVDFTKGLKPGGTILINSPCTDLKFGDAKVVAVDTTAIALRITGRTFANIPILGVLSRVSGVVTMNSLKKAITQRFGEGDPNIAAAEECFGACPISEKK